MNILNNINKLILEVYQEKNSTITHDNKKYDLNCIFRLAENIKIETFYIKDLIWILQYTKNNKLRLKNADINIPVLITKWNEKLAVIDGGHRLEKSLNLGKNTIQGKFIDSKLLKNCEI